MEFNDYLKKSRKKNNLSKEFSSENFHVSIDIIQKWEEDTFPSKNYWDLIIKTYKLDEKEFLEKYLESITENTSNISFPDFLYPEELIKDIRKMILTKEEQELLGLERLYFKGEDIDSKVPSTFLPYEYVSQVGAFNILHLHNSLKTKIGKFEDFVVDTICKNPNKIFNIYNLSPNEYLTLCNYIDGGFDDKETKVSLLQKYKHIIKALEDIENMEGKITVQKTDFLSLCWDVLEEHKDYIKFLDKDFCLDFIEVVEEKLDYNEPYDEEEYLLAKKKYNIDIAFYNNHKQKFEIPPVAPDYVAIKYIMSTDKGLKFLRWYKENIGDIKNR